MSGESKPDEIQVAVTLTGAYVLATRELPVANDDQAILYFDYTNAGKTSLDFQLFFSADPAGTDFYQETMEDEDKALSISHTLLKTRDFVAGTAKFEVVIPTGEKLVRVQFKESGGGAFGTLKITGVGNYVGHP